MSKYDNDEPDHGGDCTGTPVLYTICYIGCDLVCTEGTILAQADGTRRPGHYHSKQDICNGLGD